MAVPKQTTTVELLAATLECDKKAIKKQLDAKVDINAPTAAGNTVLHAAALGKDPAIVGFLIDHGADVNGRDKYGKTPLHCAARQGNMEIANQLMSDGRYDDSASAYQLFLVTYKGYGDRQQVQLILGLIFARYLDQRQRAKELLTQAIPRLHGDELTLAKQVLDEIG